MTGSDAFGLLFSAFTHPVNPSELLGDSSRVTANPHGHERRQLAHKVIVNLERTIADGIQLLPQQQQALCDARFLIQNS